MATINKLLLISMLVFCGCSKEQTSEPAKSLSGNYISNTFTLPDAGDRSVDVQAAGGSVQMTLTENNTYSATVNIPQSVSTVMGSGIKTYSGVFALANDTIKIDSSSFIVSTMKWNEGSNTIESIFPARGGAIFILQKK